MEKHCIAGKEIEFYTRTDVYGFWLYKATDAIGTTDEVIATQRSYIKNI